MNFDPEEITLTMNPDNSLTISPSQARKLRKEKVRFTTDQDKIFFFIQFTGGSPLGKVEHRVLKDSPDDNTVLKKAEKRTFYYQVFAFEVPKLGALNKKKVRVAVDAGCPSIIIR